MKIDNMLVSELIPYENNPRKNDEAVDAVAASIKEFGFKVPIIIDKDREIIAGHTRLKAAKRLGLKKVPVIVADDLSDEQIKAFRLADNKVAELADWDFSLLEIELGGIGEIDMSEFGFELFEEQEAEEDDYDIELPAEPKAKLGEIYKLGRHRLMCGDATLDEDVELLMDGEKADLYLTDPPYNIDYEGKTADKLKINNDSMDEEAFEHFLIDAFSAASKVLKAGGVFYIWYAPSKAHHFTTACRAIEWEVRQVLIWNKNSLTLSRQDYHWKHEPCLYGWQKGAAHYFIDDRTQSTVIDEQRPSRSAEHPTMKPVKLISRLIVNSSRAGEIVCDTFGGSGSTLIACEQLDRTCYMMELDPKYVDVIIDRWETLTGEKAEKVK